MGMETNELMRQANKELRDQRDVLVNVADKNKEINKDLERGRKIIATMSCREFAYRTALYATVFLLLIAIISEVVVKIVGTSSSSDSSSSSGGTTTNTTSKLFLL